MASERLTNRLHGLLAVKIIREQISLTNRLAQYRVIVRHPHPTSGGNDELKPNTADLRVDHHLLGDWAFIRTSLFLSPNYLLTSEQFSLTLACQRTNSSQLTRERSRVHRRWASCLRPKAWLHRSSIQSLSLLRTQITLIGTKCPSTSKTIMEYLAIKVFVRQLYSPHFVHLYCVIFMSSNDFFFVSCVVGSVFVN